MNDRHNLGGLTAKFILFSFLFFPVMWIISILYDWIFGNSGALLEIIHQSKMYHLRNFINDWLSSMPLSMLVSFIMLAPIKKTNILKIFQLPLALMLLRIGAVFALGLLIYHSLISGIILLILTAIFTSSVVRTINYFANKFMIYIKCFQNS